MAYRSWEDHIADILVTKGFRRFVGGSFLDWDITVGKMLDSPDRQITIYNTGGLAKNPRWLLDYPSIQIKVRGGPNDYILSKQQAVLANEALIGIESFTASNGDRIVHINSIGDVGSTGWDDKKRPEWIFNLRIIAEPAAGNFPGTNREAL